jgi:hypothetical protein
MIQQLHGTAVAGTIWTKDALLSMHDRPVILVNQANATTKFVDFENKISPWRPRGQDISDLKIDSK